MARHSAFAVVSLAFVAAIVLPDIISAVRLDDDAATAPAEDMLAVSVAARIKQLVAERGEMVDSVERLEEQHPAPKKEERKLEQQDAKKQELHAQDNKKKEDAKDGDVVAKVIAKVKQSEDNEKKEDAKDGDVVAKVKQSEDNKKKEDAKDGDVLARVKQCEDNIKKEDAKIGDVVARVEQLVAERSRNDDGNLELKRPTEHITAPIQHIAKAAPTAAKAAPTAAKAAPTAAKAAPSAPKAAPNAAKAAPNAGHVASPIQHVANVGATAVGPAVKAVNAAVNQAAMQLASSAVPSAAVTSAPTKAMAKEPTEMSTAKHHAALISESAESTFIEDMLSKAEKNIYGQLEASEKDDVLDADHIAADVNAKLAELSAKGHN